MHRRCWDLLLHTLYHKSIRTVYLLPHVLDIYLPDIILLVLVKCKKIKGYCWQVRIKIKQNRFYTYAYKTCFIFLVKIFFLWSSVGNRDDLAVEVFAAVKSEIGNVSTHFES